ASALQASSFRSDVTVFRLNARARLKTRSEPAFRRNTTEPVYRTEPAHNPEVAGSNPAPATDKGAERRLCLYASGLGPPSPSPAPGARRRASARSATWSLARMSET